jgi:diguanylate cyclase (GGDEF)-like protein
MASLPDAGSRSRVLVVDDDADARELLEMTLSAAGFEVALAASGAEGLARANADRPDVILLDGVMPDMDGRATLIALKDDPATRAVPVVILSGRKDVDDWLALGAVGALAKPFELGTLTSHLRKLLALRPSPSALEPSAGGREAPSLDALRASFVRRSDAHLEGAHAWLDTLATSPSDGATLRQLMRLFHNLAGMGAVYGFPRVTALGRDGEIRCLELLRTSADPTPPDLDAWRQRIDALRADLAGPAPPLPADVGVSEARGLVLVVSADPEVHRQLLPLLEAEGFGSRGEVTLADARARLVAQLPVAMIVDALLPDGSGLDLVKLVRGAPGGDTLAVVVTSPRAGFLDKVDAVISGADGYFEKPVEWRALLRRLQQVLEAGQAAPTTLLSVEDDPDQADYLRAVLESAGHRVVICAAPSQFEILLQEHQPDLILMDVVLPGVTGYDLVRTLRQDERWLTVPVIFLTTEGQLESRWRSTRVGGDDHLVKPVLPALLLSSVATHIGRARFLRQLLSVDGLTRLRTHSAFCEAAQEVVLRHVGEPERNAAWAMIDVDHFKSVNDRFGHPIGDRVLASLGTLLRRPLRSSGQAGRYGGEEFALLVEDLPEAQVVQLVERLLAEFGATTHHAADGTAFTVTFSAGVAMLQPWMTLDAWKTAADDALYAAKAAGRNQVMATGASRRTAMRRGARRGEVATTDVAEAGKKAG